MKNFKRRAEFFELSNTVDNNNNFIDQIKLVKSISETVSNHLGHSDDEADIYAQTHISNIIRENHIQNMINRIERDLLNIDKDFKADTLIEHSRSILKEISKKLKDS